MMKRTIAILMGVACATAATADPVEDRRAAMDQVRFGAATLVPMIKGEAAFDAKTAELALRMSFAAAIAFNQELFPEGATSKGANPAIWTNRADFDAKRAEFVKNAGLAVKSLPTDLAGLQAVYQPMLQNCAACHEGYRIKE